MDRVSYRVPQPYPSTPEGISDFQREASGAFATLREGRVNSTGDVTLTAGATTTFTHPMIHPNSIILVVANSAAASALFPVWVTRGQKTATINHGIAAGGESVSWVALG